MPSARFRAQSLPFGHRRYEMRYAHRAQLWWAVWLVSSLPPSQFYKPAAGFVRRRDAPKGRGGLVGNAEAWRSSLSGVMTPLQWGYCPASFQKKATSDGDRGLGTIRNDDHVLCPNRNDGPVHPDVRGDHGRGHGRP